MTNDEKVGTSNDPSPSKSPQKGGFAAGGGASQRGLWVGLFAKHWTPGATKTRLAASIGPEAAAAVSHAFVETTLERVGGLRQGVTERVLAFTPCDQAEAFESLVASHSGDWRCEPQAEGDLGQRMQSFFADALGQAACALLIGSDSPHLPLEAVTEAAAWLNEPAGGDRLVLGPTEDGGYWLIGVRGSLPPIFDRMPWSREELLTETVSRLVEAGRIEGRDYRLIEPWYDVDEADDLQRMRRELRGDDPALNDLADRLDALLGPLDETH